MQVEPPCRLSAMGGQIEPHCLPSARGRKVEPTCLLNAMGGDDWTALPSQRNMGEDRAAMRRETDTETDKETDTDRHRQRLTER